MIPPTSRDLIKIGRSKYAVVVAVAKRARELSEKSKHDENYRLSTMVTNALDDVTSGKIQITNIQEGSSLEED